MTFLAVDLGASSGRVMAVRVDRHTLVLDEVHRFPNDPIKTEDGIYWDIRRLYAEVERGLAEGARLHPDVTSIGIDSWAVDYALLDADGELLGNPRHYRDPRNDGASAVIHGAISAGELYAVNGLQFLPFTTIYQLAAEGDATLAHANRLLLIPDLMGYWCTGVLATEVTNASTTGLLDSRTQDWSQEVIAAVGLRGELFAPLRDPGTELGTLLSPVRERTGLDASTVVTTVASHDTASSVVAIPAADDSFAYVSCGTWGLVGVELERPVLSEASRLANFTNEAGVDGTVRYLRNVMGLWLLQESMRVWGAPDLDALLAGAAAFPSDGPVIDVDDARFLPPGDMPARIADACRSTDQPVPGNRASIVRCIMDSLAVAFARAIHDASQLSDRTVTVVHLVGGGARNPLLCQLTADACGLPLIAGPVEATAIGNALVQARAHGVIRGGLGTMRALVRATQPLVRYAPRPAR